MELNTKLLSQDEKQQQNLDKISGLQQDIEICLHPALKESGYFPELLGYGTEDDLPFLIMEYSESGSLMRMLYTDQTWATRLGVISDIAKGLNALHTNGFTHGDVKLENVLVFRGIDGTLIAKLSDFGLATLPSSGPERRSIYRGTWPWIPVERWTDDCVDNLESCDVWAFAFALWRVAQYRNDNSVERLTFVRKAPEGNQEYRLSCWSTLKVYIVDELSNCDTVDEHNRQAVASLFEKCVEIKPEDRPNFENIIQSIGGMMLKPEGHETDTIRRPAFDKSVSKHDSVQSPAPESEKDNREKNTPGLDKHALLGDVSFFRVWLSYPSYQIYKS